MEAIATEELALNPQLMSLLPPTAQQTRQARRLYVGNVPQGVDEKKMMDFFNKTMMDANATVMEGKPILNVEINGEKNFAFMEFRTPEEATACIHFDGIAYDGHTLRIRRPKDYQAGNMAPGIGPNVALAGMQVPDTPNKVFVGGIPAYFNEEQVQELLVTVGQLKHFSLIRDQSTGISKGYAFCEWFDDETTDKACATLNGIQLGEKSLIVQRSNSALRVAQQQAGGLMMAPNMGGIAPHPMNVQAQLQASAAAGSMSLALAAALGASGGGQVLSLAASIPGASEVPTRILLLLNMVAEEELEDPDEYQDIVADTHEECGKYGKVLGVIIPKPGQSGVGKVFVEFADISGALEAQSKLEGRKFASRLVSAIFFTEEAYITHEF